ncbi:MAG: hypothetical protein MSC31_17670 [Solirubrobacteraceae bacterium MAG38_C4-C5]|nr:hypothetical protein [Candidatus Siliceabacter maunaloa]
MHRGARFYTATTMPTTRPRHTITETDEVARALDEAAQRWPHEPRGRLLVRLVEEGRAAINGKRERAAADRHRAVRETAGNLTGVYRRDELQRLREDWPD